MELGKSTELYKATELGIKSLDAKLLHRERNMYYVGLGEDGCNKLINPVIDAGRNVSIVASIPIPWQEISVLLGSVAFLVLVSYLDTNCLGDVIRTWITIHSQVCFTSHGKD